MTWTQTTRAAPTRENLAEMLSRMTYSELRTIGDELFAMTQDGGESWNLREKLHWADMLSAWAENALEEDVDETTREAAINAE